MSWSYHLVLLAALMAGCGTARFSAEPQTMERPGDRPEAGGPAPDFTLLDHEGGIRSLSASFFAVSSHTIKEGRLVIEPPAPRPACVILGSYDCEYTLQQMDELKPLIAGWNKQGFDTYAVFSGAEEPIRQWAREHDMPFPVLLDSDRKVLDRYGVKMTPDICLVDTRGVMVYRSGGGLLERSALQPLLERLAANEPFEGVPLPVPGKG